MRTDLPSRVNLSGGLNTQQSVFVSENEAIVARNVDIGTDGVRKRQGTVSLITASVGQAIASHFFYSNTGVRLLLVITGVDLQIHAVNANGSLTLLRTKTNVFSGTPLNVTFVALPGDNLAVLVLTTNQQPVQVTLYEFVTSLKVGTEARLFNFGAWLSNDTATKIANAYGFVNNSLAGVVGGTAAFGTVTDASIALATFRTAAIIMFAVSAWTEADTWRGDNFHTIVPRLHATQADATIQLPRSITEDSLVRTASGNVLPTKPAPYHRIRVNAAPIGVSSLAPTNVLNYTAVNGISLPLDFTQTLTYQKYAFTDGTNSNFLTRYPYKSLTFGEVSQGNTHVTFGNARPYLKYTVSSANVSGGAGYITIPNHEFETGDVVSISVSSGNGFDTTGTVTAFRYVKRLDSSRFQLYTDVALTTLDLTSLAGQTLFSATVTTAQGANQTVTLTTGTAIQGGASWGTPVSHFNQGAVGNVGIASGTYYMQFGAVVTAGVSATYGLYYDPALRFRVQTMTTPIVGTGGQWYVPLDFKIERLVQDNVYLSRARMVPFNNYAGAPTNSIGIVRDNVYGTNFTEFTTTVAIDGRATGYSMFWNGVNTGSPGLIAAASTTVAFMYYIHGYTANNANDWQTIYNTARTWIGTTFTTNVLPKNNGIAFVAWATIDNTLIPASGYGRFADFQAGTFPNIGAVYNGRLVLGGMPNKPSTLLFSGVLDSAGTGYPYTFMPVYTGQDTTNAANPFDLVITDLENARITALHVWQDQLFVFTEERAYQVSATAPTQRSYKVLSGNGALNPYCITNSDRMLYFASRSGVYAVPLLDSQQYRTGDLSVKVSDNLVAALGAFNVIPFLVYNNDNDTLTLTLGNLLYRYSAKFDTWSVYDTPLGFNVQYAMIMFKWAVFVCFNKLGTTLIREGGIAYADFVSTAPPATATVFAATATRGYIVKQRFYRAPFLMTTTLITPDVNVWHIDSGTSAVTLLTYGTQYRKVNDTTIEVLVTTLAAGTLVFAPRGDGGDWFGAVTLLNSYQQSVSYGTLNVPSNSLSYTTNLLTSTLGTSLAAAGATIGGTLIPRVEVGYLYTAEYQTGAVSAEMFDMYKRCESVSVLLANDTRRLAVDAVIPQQLLNTFANVNAGVYMALKVIADKEALSDTLVNIATVAYADDYVLYRERVNILGYMFALSVVSLNANMFKLISWGADIDVRSGTGQVTGGR
jgi:hypothetical protein